MRLEAKKYLYDIQQAAWSIAEFTASKGLEDYRSNVMLRSAVERQFEIIGEALTQLAKLDQTVVARISEHRRISRFETFSFMVMLTWTPVSFGRSSKANFPCFAASVRLF